MTYQVFMEKFQRKLSFYFHVTEKNMIIEDYEEWFQNEIAMGKSEEEICRKLGCPSKLAKRLYMESSDNIHRMTVLIQNFHVRIYFLMFIQIIVAFCSMKIFNYYGYDYRNYALLLNFISVVISLFVLKITDNIEIKRLFFVGFFNPVLIFLYQLFLISFPWKAGSGEIHTILSLCMVFIVIMIGVWEIYKDTGSMTDVLLLSFTFNSVLSLFSSMNQQHLFYDDMSDKLNILIGSIFLYLETVFFMIAFFLLRKLFRRKSWMHS